jgi:hypothetical protein
MVENSSPSNISVYMMKSMYHSQCFPLHEFTTDICLDLLHMVAVMFDQSYLNTYVMPILQPTGGTSPIMLQPYTGELERLIQ